MSFVNAAMHGQNTVSRSPQNEEVVLGLAISGVTRIGVTRGGN